MNEQNYEQYCVPTVRPLFFKFFCFRSEKIQNLMREGGKKNIKEKKTFSIFLEKLMKATK